jgi:hypothetical protein
MSTKNEVRDYILVANGGAELRVSADGSVDVNALRDGLEIDQNEFEEACRVLRLTAEQRLAMVDDITRHHRWRYGNTFITIGAARTWDDLFAQARREQEVEIGDCVLRMENGVGILLGKARLSAGSPGKQALVGVAIAPAVVLRQVAEAERVYFNVSCSSRSWLGELGMCLRYIQSGLGETAKDMEVRQDSVFLVLVREPLAKRKPATPEDAAYLNADPKFIGKTFEKCDEDGVPAAQAAEVVAAAAGVSIPGSLPTSDYIRGPQIQFGHKWNEETGRLEFYSHQLTKEESAARFEETKAKLLASDDCEQYRHHQGKTFVGMGGGSTVVEVLSFLKDRKLDNLILAYVQGLAPSLVRITTGKTTTDAIQRRVTIYVDKDDFVKKIEQEFPVGYGCGHDVELVRKYGKEAKPTGNVIGNFSAISKVDFR